jgi:hypothetical protein
MGGAGLGLWRILTVSSFVAISVVEGHHTDFMIGIGKRVPRANRPYAFHMFYKRAARRRRWRLTKDDETQQSFVAEASRDSGEEP